MALNWLDNLSVVWISHVSQNEDNMMRDYFDNLDTKYNYEKIVVGHTTLDPVKYNFKYIPFWFILCLAFDPLSNIVSRIVNFLSV